jgi:hypothetical protein
MGTRLSQYLSSGVTAEDFKKYWEDGNFFAALEAWVKLDPEKRAKVKEQAPVFTGPRQENVIFENHMSFLRLAPATFGEGNEYALQEYIKETYPRHISFVEQTYNDELNTYTGKPEFNLDGNMRARYDQLLKERGQLTDELARHLGEAQKNLTPAPEQQYQNRSRTPAVRVESRPLSRRLSVSDVGQVVLSAPSRSRSRRSSVSDPKVSQMYPQLSRSSSRDDPSWGDDDLGGDIDLTGINADDYPDEDTSSPSNAGSTMASVPANPKDTPPSYNSSNPTMASVFTNPQTLPPSYSTTVAPVVANPMAPPPSDPTPMAINGGAASAPVFRVALTTRPDTLVVFWKDQVVNKELVENPPRPGTKRAERCFTLQEMQYLLVFFFWQTFFHRRFPQLMMYITKLLHVSVQNRTELSASEIWACLIHCVTRWYKLPKKPDAMVKVAARQMRQKKNRHLRRLYWRLSKLQRAQNPDTIGAQYPEISWHSK